MPPKRSLDESSSDDDLLPDNSKAVGRGPPVASAAAATPASTVSGVSPAGRLGGSFASGTTGGSFGAPPVNVAPAPKPAAKSTVPMSVLDDDGIPPPPAASATTDPALSAILAARRQSRGRGGFGVGGAYGTPTAAGQAPPVAQSTPPRGAAMPAPLSAGHLGTPTAHAAFAPAAIGSAPGTPKNVRAEAAAPARPVSPPRVDTTAEDIAKLQAALVQKRKAVEEAKQREAALQLQERQEQERHDVRVRELEADARRSENELTRVRDEHATELERIRNDNEAALEHERQRLLQSVRSQYQPDIDSLKAKIANAEEERRNLEHSLSLSSANRSIVDQAVTAATLKICRRLDEEFTKRFSNDDAWEEALNNTVHEALQASFLPQLRADEEAERAEQLRAFEDLLSFWREAEDEERQVLAKNDELLLAELQSVAHRDLDALQREEMELQQAFIRAREDWAVAHRRALDNELDVALDRRKTEYEGMRKMQQLLYAQRLGELEKAHRDEMERIQAHHDEEVRVAKEAQAERQALEDDRVRLYREVQQEADVLAGHMAETASGLNDAVNRVDGYKRAVEEREAELEKEREVDMASREDALHQIQAVVVNQCTAVDAERRALSNAIAQLNVIHQQLARQAEEQKTWVAQSCAKLERTKTEWEREYRRWQHIADQERRAAEQRFGGLMLELRRASKALQDESEQLGVDRSSLHRRAEERTARLAHDAAAMHQRQDEMRSKHDEMVQIVAELETKSRSMGDDWHRLHLERQDLHYQRQQLDAEEQRIRETEEQLKQMRGALRTAETETMAAAERSRAVQVHSAANRELLHAEAASQAQQARELALAKENLRVERAKVAAQVHQRVARATALRQQQQPASTHHHASSLGQPRDAGGSLAQRLLSEMRQAVHTDPAVVAAPAHGGGTPGRGNQRQSSSTTSSDPPRRQATDAGPAAMRAPPGHNASNVEVSRSTRIGDGTQATSHWTALERLTELESSSGSARN
jgi:hypothetical protein